MAELAVVRRYARALFDTAQKAGTVEQVEADLKTVSQIIQSTPDFDRVLRAPTLAAGRKKQLFNAAFTGRVGDLTLRFVSLVIDRRREDVLADMHVEFRRLADEWRGIQAVDVTAAVALTDAERDALAAAISQRFGKRAALNVKIDPSIMGGLVLRMGDTVIDGSVRTRLQQLRRHLLGGRAGG